MLGCVGIIDHGNHVLLVIKTLLDIEIFVSIVKVQKGGGFICNFNASRGGGFIRISRKRGPILNSWHGNNISKRMMSIVTNDFASNGICMHKHRAKGLEGFRSKFLRATAACHAFSGLLVQIAIHVILSCIDSFMRDLSPQN